MKKSEKVFVATLLVLTVITSNFVIFCLTNNSTIQQTTDNDNKIDLQKWDNTLSFLKIGLKFTSEGIELEKTTSHANNTQNWCVFTSIQGLIMTAQNQNITTVFTDYNLENQRFEIWFDSELKIGTEKVRVISSNTFEQTPLARNS